MATLRDMRLRIQSVHNLSQVTRALQTVSASRVRQAMNAYQATKPYADKAWQLLSDLAKQPGIQEAHPLLAPRERINRVLAVMISSDRGLAGAYNVDILRTTLDFFDPLGHPVSYMAIGRKGRELLFRRGETIYAEYSNLPNAPDFEEVSFVGRMAVDEYLKGTFDEVYIAYTEFFSMGRQVPRVIRVLPVVESLPAEQERGPKSVFTYEPSEEEIISEIAPRFVGIQFYQALLSAQASEHAARMVAMRNASDNATSLISVLELEYNQARQQAITNEMLDIAGGTEALRSSAGER